MIQCQNDLAYYYAFVSYLFLTDGPRDLKYKPIKNCYRPGDNITCYARAKPDRIDFEWRKIEGGGDGYISGAILTVTGNMTGNNTYQCTANNTVLGNVRKASSNFTFRVKLEACGELTRCYP